MAEIYFDHDTLSHYKNINGVAWNKEDEEGSGETENIILLMEGKQHLGDIKRECFAIIVIIGRDLLPVPKKCGNCGERWMEAGKKLPEGNLENTTI
jgi:hypothetical protein